MNLPSSDRLTVKLRRRIHASLSLDVQFELGDQVGVIFGASGAGKTTLLRLIAGLLGADDGTIRLEDRMLYDSSRKIRLPLRERKIGMIFQHDLLFPHLSVEENIGFGLKGWSQLDSTIRVEEVAKLCSVETLLDRRPETLSGGERQRVGLARSLAPRPKLLLCDEPVSALDLASRYALIDRLKAVQRAESIPILYVTHSPAEAITVGDVLFLLEDGRIVGKGAPINLLGQSRVVGISHWDGLRNVFPGFIKEHSSDGHATDVQIPGGPVLHVGAMDMPVGTAIKVEVLASDIILANGPGIGLSARNILPGIVEAIVSHGKEAEVVVRTDTVRWIASIMESAVGELGLAEGVTAYLILKARGCRVSRG